MSHEIRISINQTVWWNAIRFFERFSNEFVKHNIRLLGLNETTQGASWSPPGVWNIFWVWISQPKSSFATGILGEGVDPKEW